LSGTTPYLLSTVFFEYLTKPWHRLPGLSDADLNTTDVFFIAQMELLEPKSDFIPSGMAPAALTEVPGGRWHRKGVHHPSHSGSFCVGVWVRHPPAVAPPAGRPHSIGGTAVSCLEHPMTKSYYSVPIVRRELLWLWYDVWGETTPLGQETNKDSRFRQTRIIRASNKIEAATFAEKENPGHAVIRDFIVKLGA
jgi:hypothetical protein